MVDKSDCVFSLSIYFLFNNQQQEVKSGEGISLASSHIETDRLANFKYFLLGLLLILLPILSALTTNKLWGFTLVSGLRNALIWKIVWNLQLSRWQSNHLKLKPKLTRNLIKWLGLNLGKLQSLLTCYVSKLSSLLDSTSNKLTLSTKKMEEKHF